MLRFLSVLVKYSLICSRTAEVHGSMKSGSEFYGTSLSVRSSVEAHGARRLGAAIRGLVVDAGAIFVDAVPLKRISQNVKSWIVKTREGDQLIIDQLIFGQNNRTYCPSL